MILAFVSFLLAFTIAFGRQTAVFGKIEKSLWFCSNYERKRAWFSLFSVLFGFFSLWLFPNNTTVLVLLGIALFLIIASFLFDFKYIFPEVKKVERKFRSELDISGNTAIIGVVQNNIAVAYPLDVVIPRHIVHDTIGETPIVVSYCAMCRSALIFDAEIGRVKLSFKVSAVWRRNMIMIDDQTKSLWQQATGECIYGKFKGRFLSLLSGENTNWNSWIKKHPESEYANKCFESRKGYFSRQGMVKRLNYITPKVTAPGFTDLKGLLIRETIFGISYNGISRAYPESKIKNLIEFHDYFKDEKLDLQYDKSSEYLTARASDSNQQIIVEKHWWLGWKEFHPETEIWTNS